MKHDATIKTVTEVGLAVDEKLRILKHVIEPEHKTGKEKRICVVTGTHGDELEGQYVCYELNRILREQKEHLKNWQHCRLMRYLCNRFKKQLPVKRLLNYVIC